MEHPRTILLSSGDQVPAIGLETYLTKPGDVDRIIAEAWNVGYRHFDCAAYYGNEATIGNAIKNAQLPRNQLWLTSKLWNTEHAPDRVGPACDQTLRDLQCQYLDLYLMHFPLAFVHGKGPIPRDAHGNVELEDVPIIDTWRAMEALVDQGKVKNIGVCNFTLGQMRELHTQARIKPAVHQFECNPYLPQHRMVDFCKEHNVAMTAYRPLGGQVDGNGPVVRDDPTVGQVAQKLGKTPAQILLAWLLTRGIAIIPKSTHPDRLRENFVDFLLGPEDLQAISAILRRHRGCDPAARLGPNLTYLTKEPM
ncbi:hypothetical protein H4R34_004812 [Dimargaris verticillata]|uniref:NADP-dependent oxidoreductase domain-containing protein n=1 Tax=Dimargaris verticillata TaxID=2761393 RepID=A0A9W8EBB8_9FUNG|nr:hypothetical protein H4R34_004812 [Dimargaris verticillata]